MNKLLFTSTVLDCLIDRIKTNYFALYHEYQQKGIEWAFGLPLRLTNMELVRILAQALHCDIFDYCIEQQKNCFYKRLSMLQINN